MLSLAFDPLGLWLMSPLMIGAATVLFADPRSRRRWAVIGGYTFGIGFFGAHLWWLTASIGSVAWFFVVFAEAGWFALTGLLVAITQSSRVRTLTYAAAWVAPEVLRAQLPFGGFPWGQLGFSAVDSPWAEALPYVGVTGVSFLLALLGSGTALLATNGVRLAQVVPALTLAVASLVPAALPFRPHMSDSTTFAAIQSGVPGDGTDVARYSREITRVYADTTVDLAASVRGRESRAPDFVLWAENSTASDPQADRESRIQIERAVAAISAPLLVGALVNGPSPGTAYNRSVVWLPSGPTDRAYTKAHPVPFGEYIPFRNLLSGVSTQLSEIPRDTLPGTDRLPLAVGSLRLAVAICFDIAFDNPLADQVRAGADLIVVQTSNAKFIGTDQPPQQFTISRARALETGRSVVVASLNGRSGLISPRGEVLATLPDRENGVLMARAGISDSLTPAMRLGRYVDLAVVLLAGYVGASQAIGRRIVPTSGAGVCPSGLIGDQPKNTIDNIVGS